MSIINSDNIKSILIPFKEKIDNLVDKDNNIFSSSIKYDDNYTKMADIPYKFFNGTAVSVGTDIYLLGCDDYNYNYKYNIFTNTTIA